MKYVLRTCLGLLLLSSSQLVSAKPVNSTTQVYTFEAGRGELSFSGNRADKKYSNRDIYTANPASVSLGNALGTHYTLTLSPGSYDSSITVGTTVVSGSSQASYSATQSSCDGMVISGFAEDCGFGFMFTATHPGSFSVTTTTPISYITKDSNGNVTDSGSYNIVVNFVVNVRTANLVCPETESGSIISVHNQTVGEKIPVVGTNVDLYYTTLYASSYSGRTLPAQNYFGSNGLTVSSQHFYSSSQGMLFLGSGSAYPTGYTTLSSGNLMVVDAGGSEVYIFDSNGKHLETKTFLTGATKYTFGYDSNDRLVTITDAFSNVITLTRDSSGNLQSITGPYGQVTTIAIGTNGLVSSVTNPNSESYSFTYQSGTDLMATFTTPESETSTFTYDSDGLLTKDEGAAGNFWQLVRDSSASVLSKSSALGRTSTYSASQNLTTGNSSASSVTPWGLHTTSAEGSTFSNSSSIQTVSNTMAADERFGAIYKRSSQEDLTINSVDRVQTFTQSVVYPVGVTDPFQFTTLTNSSTMNSKTTTQVFTAATSTSVVTTPEGATATTVYNSYELPSSFQVGGDTAHSISYDTHGRISQTTQGTHKTMTYAYNSAGLLSSITDVLSNATAYAYDLAGRVTSVTYPDLRVSSFAYDHNGRLTQVTPPSRPAHVMTFNAMDLLSAYEPPALTGVSVVNTSFTYNLDKQLTQITRPTTDTVTLNYDSTTGLLSSRVTSGGTATFTYKSNSDQYDVVSSEDDFNDTMSWYGYNMATDAQRQTSTATLWGKVTLAYDAYHRVSSRTLQGKSSGTTYVRNYTYNGDDQPTQIGDMTLTYEYPSGRLSTTTLGKISDVRTYDTYGDLVTYTATYTPTSGSPTTLYSYTLTRDLLGRISSKSETIQGTTDVYDYTYDSNGRLTQVLKNSAAYSSYTYDSNGNRTSGSIAGSSFTASYDDQDRMTAFNGKTYSYNANGDLTNVQLTSTTANTFTYDALGKLKSANMAGTSSPTYSYDVFGRRVHRLDGTTFKSHFLWENNHLIANVGSGGGIQKEYVYTGENVNSPDYMVASSVNYRIIKDQLGSPRLVVSAVDGTVSERMDYNDLGAVISDSNPGFQAFGFAGGLYDGLTKYTRFGAREYDAESGRWTTKDPILFKGGDTNLFGYSANDPINFVDPSGLAKCTFSGGALSCTSNDGKTTVSVNAFTSPGAQDMTNGAIPAGTYDITKLPNSQYGTWFLDPGIFSRLLYKLGLGRGGFNLHIPGNASNGCITAPRSNNNAGNIYNLNQLLTNEMGSNTLVVPSTGN